MRLSDSISVSSDTAGASTPRRRSGYAAVAIGAVTLFVGAVALAAGTDGSGTESNSKTVSSTAPDAAGVSDVETTGAHETKDAPAISTQEADHHRGTDAKEHKASSKAHKSSATSDVESEIIVEGKQPQVPHCVPVQSTGSRLRKTVCTTPAQQQANDKYSEQQAQDYLRRLSQQATIAPPNPSPFIQSGIP